MKKIFEGIKNFFTILIDLWAEVLDSTNDWPDDDTFNDDI